MKPKLIMFGCSWLEGEWENIPETNQLRVSHPGVSEYLSDHFNVLNLARGGSSNWQSCYALRNYLEYNAENSTDSIFIIGQTDIARSRLADTFDVDYDFMIKKHTNCFEFYEELLHIFYIKLESIVKQYNCKVYLTGTLTDLETNLLKSYSNINILCSSWIKLLDSTHTESIMPLIINRGLVEMCKNNQRMDLCDELFNYSDTKFKYAQKLIESENFGPAFGDFHPSRLGHKILAEYIISKLVDNK